MCSNQEIVTLQFGNYANYIGAHWWNIQEASFNYNPALGKSEINHDILYREGINPDRQTTYTPRLLLVDLEGSLKHLPREGELYGNIIKRAPTNSTEIAASSDHVDKLKEQLQHDGTKVDVIEETPATKHEFQQDLDSAAGLTNQKNYDFTQNVNSWVDYLYARFHPRTVNIIDKYKFAENKQTLDLFSSGVELWHSEQFEDEFNNKIRQYVEECDYLQGFQTLFDCYNGYSGLATQCLDHLNDEYTKATFALPVFSPQNVLFQNADAAMSDTIRVVNSVLAFDKLIEQSSLFLPLSTRNRVWRSLSGSRAFTTLKYTDDNLYETSSIIAAYLDTISLRYRLRDAPRACSLSGFCSDMNAYGRKLAAAALSLPFPMKQNEDLIDCLDKFEDSVFTQLTPNCTMSTNYVVQSVCVRGIPHSMLKRPMEQAQNQMHMAAYRCNSISEMIQLYLQCNYHGSMAHVSSITAGMPTRVPFPNKIFVEALNEVGFQSASAGASQNDNVRTVPTLATVQNSNDLSDTLETLHREAKRIKGAKLFHFKKAGLEDDDYNNALEKLLLFKDNYDENIEL